MRPTDLNSGLPAAVFTTAIARRHGVSGTVLAGDRVHAVLHGVHEVIPDGSTSERDRLRRLVAAAQLVVPDVVASCTTACVLWGLPLPALPQRAHVCSARQVRRAELVVHRRRLDGSTDLDGVAVTTPVQTFIDVGLEVGPGWHLAIGDAMVQKNLLTGVELRRVIPPCRPHAGSSRPGARPPSSETAPNHRWNPY